MLCSGALPWLATRITRSITPRNRPVSRTLQRSGRANRPIRRVARALPRIRSPEGGTPSWSQSEGSVANRGSRQCRIPRDLSTRVLAPEFERDLRRVRSGILPGNALKCGVLRRIELTQVSRDRPRGVGRRSTTSDHSEHGRRCERRTSSVAEARTRARRSSDRFVARRDQNPGKRQRAQPAPRIQRRDPKV